MDVNDVIKGIQKKKWIFILGAVVLTGIIAVVLIGLFKNREPVLVYVNESQIDREEFLYFAGKIKMEVRDHLLGKSQKEADKFQWSQQIDGKTGYEWLVERTIEAAVPIKIMQAEAKRLGLTEQDSYDAIMKKREEENKERRKKKEKGGVLYGVVEYSKSEYYDYFNSNLEIKYQEKLISDGVLKASEEEMKEVYEEQKSYFGNEPYETVKNSVKRVVLEEKYQEYLKRLTGQAEVKMADEEAAISAIKELLGETSQ